MSAYKSSRKSIFLTLLITIVCFGCASTYKPVLVSGLTYGEPKSVDDTLRICYQYDVQAISRNKKYAAKERKYGLSAIGIRIENVSPFPVTITRDNFKIYSKKNEKVIVSPTAYSKKVRQSLGLQMLHALWGPYIGGYYVPVGLAVGINNVLRASKANEACKKTIEIYDVWNRTIAPGKALDGLITLQAYGGEPLSFSYGKSAHAPDSSLAPSENMPLTIETKSATYDFFVIPITGPSYNVTTKINTDKSGSLHCC